MLRKAPVYLLSLSLIFNSVFASSGDAVVHNANHIFNAIHSSMRQWGGSLNHNGMSLFLATVPEGTQLYHGTSDPDFVKGMQWLAFEPEHALIFARPRGGPGGPPGEGEGPPGERPPSEKHGIDDGIHAEPWESHRPSLGHKFAPEPEHGPPPSHNGHADQQPPPGHIQEPFPPTEGRGPRKHREHAPPPPLPPGHIYRPYPPPPRKDRSSKEPKGHWDPPNRRPPPLDHASTIELRTITKTPKKLNPPQKRETQHVLQPAASSSAEEHTGYLHTYTPTHALRLLYIDGLSAGKTSNGTLDTQDRLLLNLTAGDTGGPMGGEMARARGLCDLASSTWQGKIDGILRLEGGFEIILCDFEAHLRRTDVVSVARRGRQGGGRGVMGGWEYIKAITSRYHGIGGQRVRVDYDRFVTVFAYAGVRGLWDNDVQSDTRMPRLTNVDVEELKVIRDDVTALVLGKDWGETHQGRDWQAVADMVVSRYSAPLHYIATQPLFQTDKDALASYLEGLLRPFIDSSARNASREMERCVSQILPPLPLPGVPPATVAPLAHRALHAVTARVCDTLLTGLSIAASPNPHSSFSTVYAGHAVTAVQELVNWLSWTSWKDCGACADEEVCFIPIWPMGTLEDHAMPKCRGVTEAEGRMGYWGMRGGLPGKGGQPGGGKVGYS